MKETEYFDASEFTLRASIEDTHYWHVHRRAVLLQALKAFAPPETAGRLIEIGSGVGTVATHFNEHGYLVDYADYFENALAIARERAVRRLGESAACQRRFVRIDATRPLDLGGYQGALLLDVIEHVPDDLLVLSNVREALADQANTFVMVTVPAFRFLWSPWDDIEKHKRRYTRRGLASVLDRAGLKLVHSTYFFAPLFFAALGVRGLRVLRSAMGTRLEAQHIGGLWESKNVKILNRVVIDIHSPERWWLTRHGLPFGTSVLAIART